MPKLTDIIIVVTKIIFPVGFHNFIRFFVFFAHIEYQAIVIKPSNIRIWIHDKDIGKLTQVLWEGQGNRLRTEMCSNSRVKRFLDAVPYVMVSYFSFACGVYDAQFCTVFMGSRRMSSKTSTHASSKTIWMDWWRKRRRRYPERCCRAKMPME